MIRPSDNLLGTERANAHVRGAERQHTGLHRVSVNVDVLVRDFAFGTHAMGSS